MGSCITRVIDFYLPIFSFLLPSILHLGSGTGQTNRRRDNGHQPIMPPPYGGRGITSYQLHCIWQMRPFNFVCSFVTMTQLYTAATLPGCFLPMTVSWTWTQIHRVKSPAPYTMSHGCSTGLTDTHIWFIYFRRILKTNSFVYDWSCTA